MTIVYTHPDFGAFHLVGVGAVAISSELPLVLVPGSETRAGDRIIASSPAHLAFAGDKRRRPVSYVAIRAEVARLQAAREQYNHAWAAYKTAFAAYEAAKSAALAERFTERKPQMRPVKPGRRITRAEGRAMALDVGFDPSLHGMRHPDPADLAAAEAEHKADLAAYQARRAAAVAEVEAGLARPAAPSVPSSVCCTELVARHAGLFGFAAADDAC